MKFNGLFSFWQAQNSLNKVLFLGTVFFVVTLGLALNRYYSFYTSFDHGLFNQLFWNSLQGDFFQGSLSANNASASLVDKQIPRVNYLHLGQHFVLNFVWLMPVYALFPSPITLIVLQVGLLTGAGVVLYFLARCYLPAAHALLISASFYGANAIIGPAVDNFYEQCQLPLFVFGLLLALEKRVWWLFWLLVLMTLLIREDTGIILFGIGVYLCLSRRYLGQGLLLCLLSFGYVTVITNYVMPLFSNDNSRLYLGTYFKQFVKSEDPSTLELLWGILTQPQVILEVIFYRFFDRLRYLLGQWLPLAFIPVLSPAAWLISGFPLMVLLLQVANKDAVSINTRYTLSVAPGLFYGTILWWAKESRFSNFSWLKMRTKLSVEPLRPKFRKFWIGCIILSMFFTVTSNPHRSLYFMVPFAIKPWTYTSLNHRWSHAEHLNNVIQLIPKDASVSTSGYVVPHLSQRRKIVRIPFLEIKNEQGVAEPIEYALVDLWQLKEPKLAAPVDRGRLEEMGTIIDKKLTDQSYGLITLEDDIILLQKGAQSQPEALLSWLKLREELRAVFK